VLALDRLRGNRHDEEAGEDEVQVVETLDLADSCAERAAEDDEEEPGGDDGGQNRLRPEREHAAHLAAGERNSAAPLANG
jgi:hypothetical protein